MDFHFQTNARGTRIHFTITACILFILAQCRQQESETLSNEFEKKCSLTFKLEIDAVIYGTPLDETKIEYCIASLWNSKGENLFAMKRLKLFSYAGVYLTEEVIAVKGEYRLTVFAFADADKKIISMNEALDSVTSSCTDSQ
jgi:hypothetical protein